MFRPLRQRLGYCVKLKLGYVATQIALALWLLPAASWAVQLCWQNPTENVDGTPIDDLQDVVLYWGPTSGDYSTGTLTTPTDVPGDTVCTNVNPAPGDWYFVATARDTAGNESAYSNEVMKTQTGEPAAPWLVQPPQQLNAELLDVSVLVGETGVEVRFTWTGGVESETELQLVEHGKDTAILQGRTATSEWGFVPPRAGLYEVKLRECVDDVCGEWYRSSDLGYVFFFNLASPTGGGID